MDGMDRWDGVSAKRNGFSFFLEGVSFQTLFCFLGSLFIYAYTVINPLRLTGLTTPRREEGIMAHQKSKHTPKKGRTHP